MRMRSLFARSVALWRRHLPGLMLSRLIGILCHMMAAASLLLLLYPPFEWLSLLSVPLYWLMIPAMRHNHAEMLMAVQESDVYLPLHLVSGEGYGRKLLRTLGDHLTLLVSLLPLLACLLYARSLYAGTTDSFTVLRQLSDVLEDGDWLDGLTVHFYILYVAFAIHFFARGLISWRIYGRAIGASRKAMRGWWLDLLAMWGVSFIAYIPFFVITLFSLYGYATQCTDSVFRLLLNGGEMPPADGLIIATAVAFVISQPLCMLRQVMISTFMQEAAAQSAGVQPAGND